MPPWVPIALVADATKLDAQGRDAADEDPDAKTPLWHALRAFLDNYGFGPYPPAAGYQEGYEATVVALKANEAAVANGPVIISPEDLQIG